MRKIPIFTFFIIFILGVCACTGQSVKAPVKMGEPIEEKNKVLKVGAERSALYIPALKGKRIGMVLNQTSTVGKESLVDHLLKSDLEVVKIFAPEHGFRGKADAGAQVADGKDIKTGLPIISLYGKNKKPTTAQFNDLDVIVFDIQDVGARFYTYISTMHYVMQTAAEVKIPVIIFDRPNPNGHYVDGPVLELEHASFVGMHPVPIVHGMTIGEYAQMINGEAWLGANLKCDLQVIECENYTHDTPYTLPIKPSPNLPNNRSIYLYPSLCLFEGTIVSVGRGTDKQFQVVGHPESRIGGDYFTPISKSGASNPKHKDKKCKGFDLSATKEKIAYSKREIDLEKLIAFYKDTKVKDVFFNSFFTKLAGTEKLQKQIEEGQSDKEIKDSWKEGLDKFKSIRAKYLIYN